jgi:hypothetical protein
MIDVEKVELLYKEAVCGNSMPDLAYMSLDVLTYLFNRTENPKEYISDFIRDCASLGVPGSRGVCLTKDSVSLME